LAEANAKSRGTRAATLWRDWSTYKDVAHLVTAATLICAEARIEYRDKPFGPVGLRFDQLIPFQMAMLMPDLVLAVALEFERLALSVAHHARSEPALGSRNTVAHTAGRQRRVAAAADPNGQGARHWGSQ
jgi:hypothetical protein